MKKLTISSVALLVLGIAPLALAQTNATSGHWDISAHSHLHDGVTELKLDLHKHDTLIEAPLQGSSISYNFGTNAKVPVTINGNDLGSLWVSPASEVDAEAAGMPFIGFSAKDLTAPFTGLVTFTMIGFSYTGDATSPTFYMFEGEEIFFDSTAAGPNFGTFSVLVGQHGHGEFGFSDAGLYNITFQASGNNDGEPISGDPATVTFNVVPEPSTYALLGLGAGALALLRWRKRRQQI